MESLHLTRRSTLLSMGHRWQSWKATSVAQATLIDGTQTTELLTLSPSQPSETSSSSPSSSRRGSCMGMGMVVLAGMSGPKRSMAHMSTLSLEVNTTSLTTLGSATILACGNAWARTLNPKW